MQRTPLILGVLLCACAFLCILVPFLPLACPECTGTAGAQDGKWGREQTVAQVGEQHPVGQEWPRSSSLLPRIRPAADPQLHVVIIEPSSSSQYLPFLMELLDGLPIDIQYHQVECESPETCNTFYNHSLVVINCHSFPPRPYLIEARKNGFVDIGLFLLNDENRVQKDFKGRISADFDRLAYNLADYVFRNYWFHASSLPISHENPVHYIPLGWKNAFGNVPPHQFKPTLLRSRRCFFAGYVPKELMVELKTEATRTRERRKNDNRFVSRTEMLTELFKQGMLDECLHEEVKGLDVMSYKLALSDSQFGLCPFGQDHETYRLWECLHTGTIPVSTPSPFLVEALAPQPHPVLVIETWAKVGEAIARLLERPEELAAWQQRVRDWTVRAHAHYINTMHSAVRASRVRSTPAAVFLD